MLIESPISSTFGPVVDSGVGAVQASRPAAALSGSAPNAARSAALMCVDDGTALASGSRRATEHASFIVVLLLRFGGAGGAAKRERRRRWI